MRAVRRVLAVGVATVLCAVSLVATRPESAAADPCVRGKYAANCGVVAKKAPKKKGVRTSGGGGQRSYYQAPRSSSPSRKSGPSAESIYRKKVKAYKRAAARYQTALKKYRGCVGTFNPTGSTGRFCGKAPKGPRSLPALAVVQRTGAGSGPAPAAPVVTITPAEAGAIAVARLQLPVSAPGIGPDPKVNEWKMAAIGYPLWLWADGPTHIGPVGQNVAGLSVSLDATVSKTMFRMGDGKSVTCRGGGTPYAKWVQPGAKSPTCGYTYQKPSLPNKKYTVTAITYWDVRWTVNGVSGVQTVPMVGTRQLPVGELQAIIVR